MAESWRPIPGFNFYEVSDYGRVRSAPHWSRTISKTGTLGRRWRKGQILSAKPARTGYPQVTLCTGDGGRHQRLMHNLVMLAFAGEPEGRVIRHLDGNKMNNAIANLAYGTYSENAYDTVEHGSNMNANKTHCVHGHEFTAANTIRGTRGHRRCRACKNHADVVYRARRKANRD